MIPFLRLDNARRLPLFRRLLLPAFGAALLLAALLPWVARAQDWWGDGRLSGTVLNEKEQPIAGAKVTVRLESGSRSGPPPTVTDKDGHWTLRGLAATRYQLSIEAPGYIAAQGWATVEADHPSPPVDVEMRPVTEVTPSFVEGDGTSTIISWLEKGNALLAQGKPKEAREEYEKAVEVLPNDKKPETYRTIARCYFLEGKKAEAVNALKMGLVAGPQDAESRKLLPLVAAQAGQAAAAEAWLARLDREGPDALAAELGGKKEEEEGGALDLPAPQPAKPGATGALQVIFRERNPAGEVSEVIQRWGIPEADVQKADSTAGRYELAKESFSLRVPEGYRPERPAGLMVWISPTPFGGTRRPEVQKVLDEKNMIWVGANNSGNTRPKWTRISLALDALTNVPKLYAIDPRRIYVGGYSGGGRTAATLGFLYPDAVRGVFCMMGVDTYRSIAVPDRPGTHWPPAFKEPSRAALKQAKSDLYWALLTGELDFNRAQTKAVYKDLKSLGFEHLSYLEMPASSHYSGLSGEGLAKAVDALDGK